MKKISSKFIYRVVLVSCLITTFSCKKMLEEHPIDQVDVTNHYQNVFDANAAVIGIYGKFLGIADRYIVLNELRADLMSPTANADLYLRQLNEHTETTDNPWADPKPWYNIILNINDAMSHFTEMNKTGKLSNNDYLERYYDIGALRCWLYLQLGTQFGDQVLYVTDPLASIDDLKDKSKYPAVTFTELINKLVAFMKEGATKLSGDEHSFPYFAYSTTNPVNGSTNSSLNITVDGYPTNNFFINKDALLGELSLWAGNYHDAAFAFKHLSEFGVVTNGNTSAQQYYEQYKTCNCDPSASTGGLSIAYQGLPGTPVQGQIGSTFYDNNNQGWRAIFGGASTTLTNTEWIWQLPFTSTFQPTNPFINLFSNQGGSYLLTASKSMMNLWDGTVTPTATQRASANNPAYPFDARGRIAVRTINNQPVIMKDLYYYLNGTTFLPTNILQKPGRWTLFRSGALSERFAEAADNDGQYKVAYALLNGSIRNVFYDPADVINGNDVTNTQQTKLPAPYDMDARSGGPQNYHGAWYRSDGSRTRANLYTLPATLYTTNDKLGIENAIIEENARELSFEGYRWGDLVRIALRRGNPDFLASKVRDKLIADGNPGAAAAAYTKLMSPGGFYMPFKL